jgi:hypothetical protein
MNSPTYLTLHGNEVLVTVRVRKHVQNAPLNLIQDLPIVVVVVVVVLTRRRRTNVSVSSGLG